MFSWTLLQNFSVLDQLDVDRRWSLVLGFVALYLGLSLGGSLCFQIVGYLLREEVTYFFLVGASETHSFKEVIFIHE